MRSFSDHSITYQVIVFLLLLIIVPLLGLGVFFFFQYNHITEESQDELRYYSLLNEGRIQQFLGEQKQALNALAAEGVWRTHADNYKNSREQSERVQMEESLVDSVFFKASFEDIYVLYDYGSVFYSTDQRASFDQEIKQIVTTKIDQTDEFVILERGDHELRGAFITPVVFESFSGYLAAVIDLSEIMVWQEQYQELSKTGELQLVAWNEEGGVDLLLPSRFEEAPENILFESTEEAGQTSSPYLQAMVQVEEVLPSSLDQRKEVVVSATKYIEEANWGLVVKIDQREALSSLILLAESMMLIFLLIIAVGAVAVFYFYDIVSRPITELTKSAKKIEKGDLSTEIETSAAQNEIGVLSHVLRGMTEQLVSQNDQLEQAVEERTKELKKRMDELGHEKAKDAALLESIGEGMIVTDKKGSITLVNQAAEEMFGWHAGEVIGKSFESLLTLTSHKEEEQEEAHPVLVALKEAKKTFRTEFLTKRSNGEEFPIALTITPIFLNKRLVGIMAIVQDITKEKQVDKMKTEFISIASHQLRGPIASIKWYGELLKKQEATLDEKQQEIVRRINVSTKVLVSLVDDFLNVSRIESGRIKNEPKEIEVPALVKNIIESLEREVLAKNLKLTIEEAAKDPKIFADPELVREIYANLISNAVKYSHEEREVAIRLSEERDDLVLEVRDQGDGIPEADKEKIFSKFFRASNAVESGVQGTGLGLYTSDLLAKQVGGSLWFESEAGKGTTFWVRLPKNAVVKE